MQQEYEDYDLFFVTIFGEAEKAPPNPFAYQRQIAEAAQLPALVNVPTGAGKTKAILGAWLWRRLQAPKTVGRRLIYCLPMRTLVEQTFNVAEAALKRVDAKDDAGNPRFTVHKLLGGDVDNTWEHEPERESILIGTQDMLLSRALNRGYALSRFKWPVHFGLLNNDCLWVLDEVQLMGSGLAASTQLQAFRRMLGSFGNTQTIWMSATVERDWLATADIDLAQDASSELSLDLSQESSSVIHDVMLAKKFVRKTKAKAGELPKLAKEIISEHCKAGRKNHRTLAVVNTVNRASQLLEAIKAELQKQRVKLEPVLIHSRFRPPDRARKIAQLLANPDERGAIIVSTQVIEAGVDVTTQTLFTELAPWPSLVQRFGRCNRRGEYKAETAEDTAEIYWMNVKAAESAPYEEVDLKNARLELEKLDGQEVGPLALRSYADSLSPQRKAELFRYEHTYVLRQHDLHGLFSTEADLAGGYTDVSMFVRNIERETDVYVYWRNFKGKPERREPPPSRDELCPVRFVSLMQFLEKTKGTAWLWNYEGKGEWQAKRAKEIKPGMTLLLAVSQGGYNEDSGWTGKATDKPVVQTESSNSQPQEALDDELLSETDYWLTVPDHLRDTEAEARDIVRSLQFQDDFWPAAEQAVIKGAWWHDVGKTLSGWQQAAAEQIEEMIKRAKEFLAANPNTDEADFVARFLAKLEKESPAAAPWAKFPNLWEELEKSKLLPEARRRIKQRIDVPFLPGLRHEVASALAALDEWQNRVDGWSALAVYLVLCHHGKVRTVLRGTSKDGNDVFGVKENSVLPAMGDWLATERLLDLRPKAFGAIGEWDETGQHYTVALPSWIQVIAELLGPELPGDPDPRIAIMDEREPRGLGPFRLAFLEALIRAADVRASREPGKGKNHA
jgi:CRISPR-associated endonuclease/helicase Cas3